MTERIRLLLADDHNVVRAGLHAVLATEPDLLVVEECATAEDAVRIASTVDVDVVLMDLQFGAGMDGATATAAITATADAPRVLILTTYDADVDILDPVLTVTGMLRVPIFRSNFAGLLALSTNGEIGIGITLLNSSILPVLP